MTDTPHVSIIVLNYNGREQLRENLPSILDLDYDNYQVIVVDNASTDGSVDFLHSEFPEVTVVENEENVGFSQGNNIGAARASDSEYLWFLNTDVRVESSSLDHLVDHVDATEETGIVVPRIDYMDDPGTIQTLGFDLEPQWIPKARDQGRQEPSNPDPQTVTYASGAALLIDHQVWSEIGGFDDENFIFGDDIYLCLLAWMRGYRVEAVPDGRVFHEEGTSRAKIPVKVAYHDGRSNARSYLKLMQPRSLLLGLPGFVLHGMYLMVGDVLLRNSLKAACYRFLGYLSPLADLPSLIEQRREIQRRRRYDDEQFLTDGQLSTLRRMLDLRTRSTS